MAPPITDRWRRGWLILLGLCWLLIGIANTGVTELQRYAPRVTAALAFGAAACVFVLAVRPRAVFAYRFGGTLGVGALLFRLASVAFGLVHANQQEHLPVGDVLWITTSALGTTMMLATFWWKWWLTDVKEWHECHKRLES